MLLREARENLEWYAKRGGLSGTGKMGGLMGLMGQF